MLTCLHCWHSYISFQASYLMCLPLLLKYKNLEGVSKTASLFHPQLKWQMHSIQWKKQRQFKCPFKHKPLWNPPLVPEMQKWLRYGFCPLSEIYIYNINIKYKYKSLTIKIISANYFVSLESKLMSLTKKYLLRN